MTQLGMQLPGSHGRRMSASMNVYTALMFVACLCLLAAVVVVYRAGSGIAPEGQPWKTHPAQQPVRLPGAN
ncbi:MAG: hypothetical protein EA379_05360 [Phycisphaerales bacterium]|nr:MAG: hypothetical protein EA379_05360 [Phycisphaerales bacterium]